MNTPVPPNWGKDPLSDFVDVARHNSFATFANCPVEYNLLSTVDGLFRHAIDNLVNTPEWFAAFFLLKSHSAYLGASAFSISGQCAGDGQWGRPSILQLTTEAFGCSVVHMPRQARLDIPGTLHHVMIRGIERRNIFRNNRDRNDFINRLATLMPETQTSCYAWAFLPNHAHFLLRSGPTGIAHVMRKLLTGYVVSFNRRYHRSGQLFQNRYKSIICQEEIYFKELVRYIHLNPIRAGVVSDLSGLDRFAFSGHSALLGNEDRVWQEKDYILRLFAQTESEARKNYRSFIETGLQQGKREDLTGGGLVRSIGGWSELKRQRERVKGDQRILGDSDFVLGLLKNAEEQYERQMLLKKKGYTLEAIAHHVAKFYGLAYENVVSKGREGLRVDARSLFCYIAVRDLGVSVTDVARLLRMAASSVSYAVRRGRKIANKEGFHIVGKELLK